ncbi:capsule biosynthesis protein [Oceanisphaera arctica]|uniref:Capsule biosynthesis protein n=1 Tax=Oceanisphaera arctica TaxID=641510 RepID=A0A2P5TR53_9GAMM|nr:capsular biosynthesis protein [Oceanisphaera arctica]PPL18271.1 capsule biosynthesis protein [Oceanisphaera arctica]
MRSILLLQGPLGPFFQHFSRFLASQGIRVHKLNFNGGDESWPCVGSNISYRGSLVDWPAFLDETIKRCHIDTVFCYNDCRLYHHYARQYCQKQHIGFYVFEEGYLRPDYITLEPNGVNAHSTWYGRLETLLPEVLPVEKNDHFVISPTFQRRIGYAIRYYISMQLHYPIFTHYQHHRCRTCLSEGLAWLKGLYTKYIYKNRDQNLKERLIDHHSGHIFLVPLQVTDDFQVRIHSCFGDTSQFIRHVLLSFSSHANDNDVLVFKHHPMDRGYTNYKKLIRYECERLGINERIFYGYDLSLPELYPHCKAVVTVNSTAGMSALLHSVPTITLGKAIYDIPGLTSQNGLDQFWKKPCPVNAKLFKQLRCFMLNHTQLNGSFYGEYQKTCEKIWQRLLVLNSFNTVHTTVKNIGSQADPFNVLASQTKPAA